MEWTNHCTVMHLSMWWMYTQADMALTNHSLSFYSQMKKKTLLLLLNFSFSGMFDFYAAVRCVIYVCFMCSVTWDKITLWSKCEMLVWPYSIHWRSSKLMAMDSRLWKRVEQLFVISFTFVRVFVSFIRHPLKIS